MRRVVFFLIIGIVVVAAAWGLGNLPGHISATVGSIAIETSASLAILALVLLFVVCFFVLWLLSWLASLPKAVPVGVGGSGSDKARNPLRVLVALAAGEQSVARKESRRARQLLGESPQTLLLMAEASRLSGHEDEAQEAFQALTRHEDGKFLGLRGLLRQAMERRDWLKADELAREAEAAHPGSTWLRQQRAELAIQSDNWVTAVQLSGPQDPRSIYCIGAADAETDPRKSLQFSRDAWKADPRFSPAVLSYARRLREAGRERRVQAIIANTWKVAPHPDLAEFALAPEPRPIERFQLGRRLVADNPAHPESRLLMAKLAIEAGHFAEARAQTDAALAEGLNRQRLWLLIADIEEAERGDTEEGQTAQRNAMRKAASADPDPTWRCTNCRSEQAHWSPKCPSCSSVATLKWQSEAIPALPVVA